MSATHCPICMQDFCNCDYWLRRVEAAKFEGWRDGFAAAIEAALVNARIHEADLRRMRDKGIAPGAPR